jgi:hypothetical protein
VTRDGSPWLKVNFFLLPFNPLDPLTLFSLHPLFTGFVTMAQVDASFLNYFLTSFHSRNALNLDLGFRISGSGFRVEITP